MKINPSDYRVNEGDKVDLDKRPTKVKPVYDSKKEYEEMLGGHIKRLIELQHVLYAADTTALLLIFQGMDAAGKDGAIRHVMSGVNPQGCEVHAFKQPSAEELQHDFLWRCTKRLPERGRIGIFNRSYYEELLVVRVHPELLAAQGLNPQAAGDNDFWKGRFKSIVNFEQHLHRNKTRVIKFFLHLSRDEQRKRFLSRIDEPEKHWKFSMGDITERGFWKSYMNAYEECLSATSSKEAPWHVVPADDKETARLIVSQTILEALEDMDLSYPQVSEARLTEMESIRDELAKGK